MIIFNESTILARRIHNSLPCKIISVCGFLYDYIVENNVVSYYEKDKTLIDSIKLIKNETIIIATDLDSAGELIALELIGLLKHNNNKIFRLNIAFEELLNNDFDFNNILDFCVDTIDTSKIKQYLSNKDVNIKNKRIGAIKYIINNEITDIEFKDYV